MLTDERFWINCEERSRSAQQKCWKKDRKITTTECIWTGKMRQIFRNCSQWKRWDLMIARLHGRRTEIITRQGNNTDQDLQQLRAARRVWHTGTVRFACRHAQLQEEAIPSQGYAVWEIATGDYFKTVRRSQLYVIQIELMTKNIFFTKLVPCWESVANIVFF